MVSTIFLYQKIDKEHLKETMKDVAQEHRQGSLDPVGNKSMGNSKLKKAMNVLKKKLA